MALTRDFLRGLGIEGLTDEHLKKIMDEHGETINSNKKAWEETKKQLDAKIETLEGRADITPEKLKEIQDQQKQNSEKLKSFEGVDLEGLNKQLEESANKIAEIEEKHKAQLQEMEIDAYLREAMAKISFSSNYARKGIYDEIKERITYEPGGDEGPGKIEGIEEALEELRELEPSAFLPDKDSGNKDGGGNDKDDSEPGERISEGRRHSGGDKTEPKVDIPLLI